MGKIQTAEALLHEANASGPSGRYQIEAAIQSAHMTRRLSGRPHAAQSSLSTISCSRLPVAALNRAVALAAVEGPAEALASTRVLQSDARMLRYQPHWAVRGHLLAQAGRRSEACEALTVAMGLSMDDAVKLYLAGRRAALAAVD